MVQNKLNYVEGDETMILNKSKFFFAPAVILFAALFEVVPAAAGCGFYGCGGGAVVIVQPQPYVYQSCSCCGCGASSYYGAYAPVYGYQPSYS
jgi:hypothetical protein